ncbi:MAG TPA: hypothetical protein VIH99_01840 [Bdellovibrionota bacterium]|jgi:hypothetical protein
MISLKAHNILDYVGGAFLLFVPAIIGISEIDAARNIFIFAGLALIGYSLLTNYEYALWRIIPLGVHMSLDVLTGVVVMLAPWVFGYRDLLSAGQEIAHYLLALGVFGLVAFTRPKSETEIETTARTYPGATYDSRNRRAG